MVMRQLLVLSLGAAIGSTGLSALAQATNPRPITVSTAISTTSGAAEMALAEHLTRTGVLMYGAHWCGFCHKQKQVFGAQAWPKIRYIECAAGGTQAPDAAACDRAKIRSYPTWEIGGRRYEGAMSLFRLAKLSGYTGPTTFKNTSALYK
jgi:hypothetical protein